MAKAPYAYFAFKKKEGAPANSFSYGNLEFVQASIAKWTNPVAEEPKSIDPDQEKIDPDFTYQTALADALAESVEFGLANFQLILVASTTPSMFNMAMTRDGLIKRELSPCVRLKTSLYNMHENEIPNPSPVS